MHLVVPSLTEQDCVVVDSTAVSCPWLNGTGRDWAELLQITLLCTALHWTSFDCNWLIWTWAMLDQMYLVGREWIEIRLDGTELAQNPLNVLDRTSVEWSGLDWTEPDSTSEPCFEHTNYVTMGIVLVFLNLSHNWILTVNRHLWTFWWAADCALFENTSFFCTENGKLLREKKVLKY